MESPCECGIEPPDSISRGVSYLIGKSHPYLFLCHKGIVSFNALLILQVVSIHAHTVLASPQFEGISKSALTDIVQLSSMNTTSEAELFDAVTRWATSQCKEKGTT